VKHASVALTALFYFIACAPTSEPPTSKNGSHSGTGGDSSGAAGSSSGATGKGGTTGQGGTNGQGGTGGDTGGGGSGGVPGFNLACEEPVSGPPVLRLLTRGELTSTIGDVFPGIDGQWSSTLPASTLSVFGFDNDASARVGNQFATALLETAESIGTAVSGNALANLLPCSASTPNAACAGEFVTRYGRRLFRRPLTSAEQQRYVDLHTSISGRSDFKTGIKWVTAGLIQSPNAVYRREIGADSGGTRTLTPHELATELAYTFTGSTPSEDLLMQADSGSLGSLPAVAEQLLATDRGKQAVQRFFEQYLGYTRATAIAKPNIADYATVTPDMVQETRAFIDAVLIQGGGSVRELLTSPTTYPSTALASYYGMPAPASNYAAVTRPAGQGIGILAQGSFLASHANALASSPTQRGIFVLLRMLCQPKPEPPQNVPMLGPPEPGVRTTRQRYEEAHAQPGSSCAGCHANFDPIGFGFEHFDEGGKWRDQDSNLPIDSSGLIYGPTGDPLFTFQGEDDLMTNLAMQESTSQCFSAYLALYAFGSPISCLGPSSADALFAGTKGITKAFADLAAEPHFSTRR
jgi:hypothetical protein